MGHGHSHSHGKTTADIWTMLAAAGELIPGVISNTFWIGGAIDLIGQLDEQALGLSYYGMSFGAAASIIITISATYSHTVLNVNNQNDEKHDHDDEHDDDDDLEAQPLVNDTVKPDTSLTVGQQAALVGDFIAHTGETSGPIVMGADIVIGALKPANTFLPKVIVAGVATLFGAVASVADVRTCYTSMVERNEAIAKKHH
jgi:hypothetical protein